MTELDREGFDFAAQTGRAGSRPLSVRGGCAHPLAELAFVHPDDSKPLCPGGLAPHHQHPLPSDSKRLGEEPRQPRVRLSPFRGRAHVDSKHTVVESADAVARGSGLDANFHLDIA